MGFPGRLFETSGVYDFLHERIGKGGSPRTWGILPNPLDPQQSEPSAPESHGDGIRPELLDDTFVRPSLHSVEDDLGSEHEALLDRASPSPMLELVTLFRDEGYRRSHPHKEE
jgi:hypothetical protein